MRILRTPAGLQSLPLPRKKRLSIQEFLERKKSGLAQVTFQVPPGLRKTVNAAPIPHTPAIWLGRLRAKFRISARWLLMIGQCERGIVLGKKARSTECIWRKINDPKECFHFEKPLRSKAGWIATQGDRTMMFACGFAIPDPNRPAPFTTELYIGFIRQFYHAAKWLRARINEFRKKKKEGRKVTVRLYGGERVECADILSYLILRYTPNERELTHRIKVYRSLFGIA